MEKEHFSLEEVVSFLEMKLEDNTATYEQEQMYIDYKWSGKIKKTYTYKKLTREMREWY
jgi:hypothetical protein